VLKGSRFVRQSGILLSALLLHGSMCIDPAAVYAQAAPVPAPSPAPAPAPAAPKPAAPAAPAPSPTAPAPAAPVPAPVAPAPVAPPPAAPADAPIAQPIDPEPPTPLQSGSVEGDVGASTVLTDEPSGPPLTLDAPTGEEPYFDDQLDVITVTVDRRAKRLQDYGGSASAFTQDDLQRAGVNSVRTLGNAQPNVSIGIQEGNAEIFIRGVGSDYNTELGDPSAATHIDGVYIPRPRGVGSMFFDLERVEINRGPQGTLRGRNATAGSVNMISNKPKLGEWGASGEVQLGNYAQRLTRAMLNIPIGDTLAVRFATFSEVHEPFFENGGPVKTITPAESADVLAYRASLKWEPWKRLTAVLVHDYTQEKGTGYTGSNFADPLQAGLLPDEVENPRSVVYRGPQSSQNMKHWGVTADLTLDLGPALIGYLGSYRDLSYKQVSGGNSGVNFNGKTGLDLDNWGTSYWHTTSKSTVQELRVYAPDSARVRWTVGGFFFDERQNVFLGSACDKCGGFLGTEFNMPDVNGQALAGFADATVDILKSLRGLAGVRFTSESKSRRGVGNVYSLDGAMGTTRFGTEGFSYAGHGRKDFTEVAGSPNFADFTNGVSRFGARDTVSDTLMQPGVKFQDNLNEQDGSYDNKFVDFRVGLEHDITPDNLLYATFSTGHKSGGFNDNVKKMDGTTVAPTYKPEVLYSTEIGSKNEFLDRRLITNVSAFWYNYKEQQFQSIIELVDTGSDDGIAASSLRFNAADSRVLGAELDATARLPYGLTANLALMILDPKIVKGKVADTRLGYGAGDQPIVDLKGQFLPRASRAALNYGLGQTIESAVGYFDWLVSAQTKTKHFMTVFNGEGRDAAGNVNGNLSDVVPTYTRLDANIGYMRPDGKTRLDIFGTNLTDATYMTSIINTPGLNLRFFNPPRQFGARLTVQL
jgi:iron complex outermembrane recepter protein